ncbi:intracellular adhesion protein IcaD [Staphylococcus aureus]
MVKSGQRKYFTLKSNLNIIRESIILFISFIFWFYCSIAFIVIGGSLLNINAYIVLLIRSILNIEITSMNAIFINMLIFMITAIIIFTISLSVQKYKYKKAGINHGKLH